jgi:hypothetical protein
LLQRRGAHSVTPSLCVTPHSKEGAVGAARAVAQYYSLRLNEGIFETNNDGDDGDDIRTKTIDALAYVSALPAVIPWMAPSSSRR